MKIAFTTLGCKANQSDTQAMEALALARGHALGDFTASGSDAYVVNTCTVTAVSDKKSRQLLRRTRRENPGAILAVCGCFAQMAPETARELGADVVGGSRQRAAFLDAVEEAFIKKSAGPAPGVLNNEETAPHPLREAFERLPAGGLRGRTRALLKVQDGCDNYCSYCIIPYARGHVRSLPLAQAEAEIRRLRDEGVLETVITGIEISSYGRDLDEKSDLVTLIEGLSAAAGPMRLHLGSLEPRSVDEAFCRRLAALPNLCPHFHVSLQSGCDDTLRRMRRRYDTALYARALELLRRYFENCLITTDLITGFPGESEEEFAATLSFLRRCAFGAVHVFPYSPRQGTPAAALPQLPRSLREARAAAASAVAAETRTAFLQSQTGRTLEVLWETKEDGRWRGHGQNYLEVSLPADITDENLRGTMRPVVITGLYGDGLTGNLRL